MTYRQGRTGPIGASKETSQLYSILARANRIASSTELDDLLSQMLDLIIKICGANAGTLYLLDEETDELVFKVVKGDAPSQKLLGQRLSTKTGIIGAAVQGVEPLVVDDLPKDPRWFRPPGDFQPLKNSISVPLLLRGEAIGAVQVFNFTHKPLQLVQLLGNRMASEIEKAVLLRASERRGERMEALVSIIGQISSALDQDLILNLIIDNARQLLNAEASSLFLLDEETGELRMHIAQDLHQTKIPPVRLPAGKGIIGYVAQTGKMVLVNDISKESRHFKDVDDIGGIETKSVLAVPLISQPVIVGPQQGATKTRITGGLEVINKIEDRFTQDDAQLLRALANQAATVLHIAQLYSDANELFLDTIRALVAAIDAKDPYTEGHSQRVSEFSVEIAGELGMDQERINHIRLGSLLHDVGKIGIQDSILQKPKSLTPDEFDEMKKHPTIGATIMNNVRMLQNEIPALEQHHEWMNGNGYPRGLVADEISLIGRIVAVADVFDAVTSDRPYRNGVSADEALEKMLQETNGHLDLNCVQALITAREKGRIKIQKERNQG